MGILKRGHRICNGEGLTSKVFPFHLPSDSGGEFISYCNYRFHKGVVLRPEVCEARKCIHSHKFYIAGNNLFQARRNEPTVTRPAFRLYGSGGNGNHHQ
jgi:hypothetical protein